MSIRNVQTLVPAPGVTVVTAPYAPTGGVLIGSSDDSHLVGVPQTLTLVMNEFGLGYAPGVRVRAAVTATPNVWMEGVVQSYVEPNLVIAADLMPTGITGTYSGWTVSVTGQPGAKGDAGPIGPQGQPGIGGAPTDSPVFTGQPQVPTPVLHDNSTVIANTNWVGRELTYFAPLASPVLTGSPKAPTVASNDNSTNIATTAMVQAALSGMSSGLPDAPASGGPFARKAAIWYDLSPDFAAKAPLASPAFTGAPTVPLAPDLDNSTKIASTNWVNRAISEASLGGGGGGGIADAPNDGGLYSRQNLTWTNVQPMLDSKANLSTLSSYAPITSPAFLGIPTAPTQTAGDSSTRLATTGFVAASFAPLASPALTGNPTAPTQANTDNSTKLATTAFVKANTPSAIAANVVLEVSMAANKTGLGAGWSTCKYDTKVTDAQSGYSTSTGLFTPTVAGLYAVSASIATNNNVNTNAGVAIVKNGSLTNPESQGELSFSVGTATISYSRSALIYCNGTTDTISVQGYNSSSSQQTFYSSAAATVAINMVATLLQTGPKGDPGPVGPAGPGQAASIALEVSQTANSGAITPLGGWSIAKYFDSKITDTQNGWNAATGLFTPKVAGVYVVTATLGLPWPVNGFTGIGIFKNGSPTNPESQTKLLMTGSVTGANGDPISTTAQIYCNGTTDTISVWAYLSATSSGIIFGTTAAAAWCGMVATPLQAGPKGDTGPSGSWTLLSTLSTPPATPTLVFQLTGGYRRFKLIGDSLQTSAGSNALWLQVSEDGGATWKTTGSYANAMTATQIGVSAPLSISSGADQGIRLFGNLDLSAPALGTGNASFELIIMASPAGSIKPMLWMAFAHTSAGAYTFSGSGAWEGDSGMINAVRLIAAGGANISQGNVSLYGITS